jgi:protein-disulfide isomerase
MIDGEPLTGAQPIDKFKETIDAHLKKAAELKAAGKTDAEMYAAMVNNYFKAQPEAAKGEEKPAEEPDDFTVWKVEVGDSPVLGKADAPITVVSFSEFQCPYCKRIDPTLMQLKKEYGDKVRLVFKINPLPFHNRALPTAHFALEAMSQKGNDGFWKAHDKLFEIQPKLEDADLEAAAKDLGLDWGKVSDAMKTNKWKDKIQADMDQGEALQVRGTPHSFVNGRVVNGAVPYEKFKKIVDQELPKAEAKIKAGTPATSVYAEIIKDGKIISNTPLPVPAYSPWKGAKDAKVVIQVFSDFQCPFCKRAEFDTPGPDGKVDPNAAGMKVAFEKYSDKIKVVWRNFPLNFHNRAEPAAQFSMCAFKQKGNDTFWKVHDELFAIQPKLEDADFEGVAKKFGIDWAACKKEMDDHKYKTEIDQDMKDGGSVGVTGTPAFIINGKPVVGAQPFEAFQKAIDAALAKAK